MRTSAHLRALCGPGAPESSPEPAGGKPARTRGGRAWGTDVRLCVLVPSERVCGEQRCAPEQAHPETASSQRPRDRTRPGATVRGRFRGRGRLPGAPTCGLATVTLPTDPARRRDSSQFRSPAQKDGVARGATAGRGRAFFSRDGGIFSRPRAFSVGSLVTTTDIKTRHCCCILSRACVRTQKARAAPLPQADCVSAAGPRSSWTEAVSGVMRAQSTVVGAGGLPGDTAGSQGRRRRL